ncbi:putative basic-leucine zipper transcription factor [Tieghemostelium lacteum]|uniref:Putative basic-leucine zipper transcription factor n=1 Tax=Tieghemostelium lacteum TaxID=361077 RepID=A0A151ZJ60_TIELA|nr:putative basic-leucine zipper transcription factor [Tieghemostelium lacteum]|eukprot:KYQ93920.1 putative basic-leucine zipper transcription factor [Tieghemostelium lacteum]
MSGQQIPIQVLTSINEPLSNEPSSSEMDSSSNREGNFQVNKMKLDFPEDRHKKRQVRLEKNRKSAALSRHRKKEYISNLEAKAQELKQTTQEAQITYNQLSTKQMESIVLLESLDKSLNKLLSENEILKRKIQNLTNGGKPSSINTLPIPTITASPSILSSPMEQLQLLHHHHHQQQQQQQQKKKEDREIIIGVNKFSHLYNSNSKSIDHEILEKPPILNTTNNNNNSNNNIFNNLSYSNPNVNSSPIYLTRARSSSYHPISETNLIVEALSNLNNTLVQSPNPNSSTNTTTNNCHNITSTTSETSSPILPSLSLLTKNLGCHSPSPTSPLSSISSPLLSLSPIQSPSISHSRAFKKPLSSNLNSNINNHIMN